eukprot:355511-Chlamydomonas_euryale.AAC.3
MATPVWVVIESRPAPVGSRITAYLSGSMCKSQNAAPTGAVRSPARAPPRLNPSVLLFAPWINRGSYEHSHAAPGMAARADVGVARRPTFWPTPPAAEQFPGGRGQIPATTSLFRLSLDGETAVEVRTAEHAAFSRFSRLAVLTRDREDVTGREGTKEGRGGGEGGRAFHRRVAVASLRAGGLKRVCSRLPPPPPAARRRRALAPHGAVAPRGGAWGRPGRAGGAAADLRPRRTPAIPRRQGEGTDERVTRGLHPVPAEG